MGARVMLIEQIKNACLDIIEKLQAGDVSAAEAQMSSLWRLYLGNQNDQSLLMSRINLFEISSQFFPEGRGVSVLEVLAAVQLELSLLVKKRNNIAKFLQRILTEKLSVKDNDGAKELLQQAKGELTSSCLIEAEILFPIGCMDEVISSPNPQETFVALCAHAKTKIGDAFFVMNKLLYPEEKIDLSHFFRTRKINQNREKKVNEVFVLMANELRAGNILGVEEICNEMLEEYASINQENSGLDEFLFDFPQNLSLFVHDYIDDFSKLETQKISILQILIIFKMEIQNAKEDIQAAQKTTQLFKQILTEKLPKNDLQAADSLLEIVKNMLSVHLLRKKILFPISASISSKDLLHPVSAKFIKDNIVKANNPASSYDGFSDFAIEIADAFFAVRSLLEQLKIEKATVPSQLARTTMFELAVVLQDETKENEIREALKTLNMVYLKMPDNLMVAIELFKVFKSVIQVKLTPAEVKEIQVKFRRETMSVAAVLEKTENEIHKFKVAQLKNSPDDEDVNVRDIQNSCKAALGFIAARNFTEAMVILLQINDKLKLLKIDAAKVQAQNASKKSPSSQPAKEENGLFKRFSNLFVKESDPVTAQQAGSPVITLPYEDKVNEMIAIVGRELACQKMMKNQQASNSASVVSSSPSSVAVVEPQNNSGDKNNSSAQMPVKVFPSPSMRANPEIPVKNGNLSAKGMDNNKMLVSSDSPKPQSQIDQKVALSKPANPAVLTTKEQTQHKRAASETVAKEVDARGGRAILQNITPEKFRINCKKLASIAEIGKCFKDKAFTFNSLNAYIINLKNDYFSLQRRKRMTPELKEIFLDAIENYRDFILLSLQMLSKEIGPPIQLDDFKLTINQFELTWGIIADALKNELLQLTDAMENFDAQTIWHPGLSESLQRLGMWKREIVFSDIESFSETSTESDVSESDSQSSDESFASDVNSQASTESDANHFESDFLPARRNSLSIGKGCFFQIQKSKNISMRSLAHLGLGYVMESSGSDSDSEEVLSNKDRRKSL